MLFSPSISTASLLVFRRSSAVSIGRFGCMNQRHCSPRAAAAVVGRNKDTAAALMHNSPYCLGYRFSSCALSSSSDDDDDEEEDEAALAIYESALKELESEKLYGSTPKLYDLDQLANMARQGRLNLAPKYQRGYVWKVERASRLVVTALCNRVIPGIVLHEKKKGEYDVVDGKQRLTSLLSFYLAGEDPALYEKLCKQQSTQTFGSLQKLDENYESLEGLSYNCLCKERQRALQSFSIPCTIIPYGTPKEEVFSVYEDINSGGEDLKAQQLRRAVYYGDYIEMLDELAKNQDFQCIRDPKAFHKGKYQLCPQENDRELILRAFTWCRNHANYKRPIKKFLNTELQLHEDTKQLNGGKALDEIERLKDEFRWVMKVSRNIFSDSDSAFRARVLKKGAWAWNPSISVGLWDVMYLVFCKLRKEFPTEPIYVRRKEQIQDAIQELFESGTLDVSGSSLTSVRFEQRYIVVRQAIRKVLLESAEVARSRIFFNSNDLKKALYEEQNGKCSICEQTIDERRLLDGSYVHLDHVTPFSRGGESKPDNAALAHAACNQSKGANAAADSS